ncbi:flavin reductase family protein [Streptomyces sp. H27-H1]|uniref:flavin reductase family protein n=1 Tax=Streptomyces sp. H27-H1 TaxID=2996461 RepID=UPI00226DAAB6|nr:flavin reductase family protein [Streptomyces sp. H27-H1]MCY0927954.1 flavin reductase family protein [Streptomyces sp. H27-H1]
MSTHAPLSSLALRPRPGAEDPGRRFRSAAGRFPTGVTVVTALEGGRPHGTTVNSFTTVSVDPCLVLVALGHRSRMHDKLLLAGSFTVSVLSDTQEDDARWFADPARPDGAEAFIGRPWRTAAHSGAPILLDGVAYFDCAVEETRRAGDHTLVVGRVEEFGVLRDGPALVFADSAFAGREERP